MTATLFISHRPKGIFMSNALAIVGTNLAQLAIKEASNLIQSTQQYRIAKFQVEAQREQMHLQAELTLTELKHTYKKDIKHIKAVTIAFDTTTKQQNQQTRFLQQQLEQLTHKKYELLDLLLKAAPQVQTLLLQSIEQLTHEYNLLLAMLQTASNQPMNSFMALSDSLRTSPRVFTEVA